MESSQISYWNNMHNEEKQALKSLAEGPERMIKEADKGGGVVILDKKRLRLGG